MPQKSKFKIKKGSKQPVGNISLHFKDLCDAESDSENQEALGYNPEKLDITSDTGAKSSPLTETAEVDFNSNEMENLVSTTIPQTGVDPLMTVPLENITSIGKIPSKSMPVSSSGAFGDSKHVDASAPVLSLFGDDVVKPKNSAPVIPKSQRDDTSVTQNKIPTMQSVEDHPLALGQPNDGDDSDSDEQFEAKPDHFSVEKGSDTVTKEMISSALFDSKARTHLFSTIKKNIQQYKNSTVKADSDQKLSVAPPKSQSSSSDINHAINSSDVSVTGQRVRSVSQSSDILSQFGLNPESPLMKGLNRKVVEPLQAMKKAWEDNPKENTLTASNTDPELRKRSSSENYFSGSVYDHRKSLSSNSDELIFSPKSVAEPTRSSSMAMSLSSLLAERQQSILEDRISPSKEDISDSGQKQKTEEENKNTEKNFNDGIEIESKFSNKEQKSVRSVPSSSIYLLYFSFIFIYFYFVLPLPFSVHIATSFFFIGFVCSTIIFYVFIPSKTQPVEIKPPYISQTVPHKIPKLVFNPSEPFKGWMNEIDIYDLDTYHVSATQSVFVTLEGKTLRLQTPRRNIPKRAVFGERNIQVSNVIHQRILDVTKAKVYLVPDGLVKKRVWSKKYPICIEFSPSFEKKRNKEKSKTTENRSLDDTYDVISDDDLSEKIYLFGRTQRQKEEWFYRFQRAITISQRNADKLQPSPEAIYPQEDDLKFGTEHSQRSDSKKESKEMKPFDKLSSLSDPIIMYQDYYTSMCRLLPDPAVYTTVKSGSSVQELSKDSVNIDQSRAVHFSTAASQSDGMPEVVMSQPRQIVRTPSQGEPGLEVAWFNVVVGRIMFDFLRLPKWADWLSNKIQRKLEKIRLPYFMDGLKLTELDLGTTVPLVHKISLPRLDSQGIWLDMDITYNGAVQMTLETKMVLTKLGKQNIVMSVNKDKLGNKSAITNSEEEDSAESSDDDESILTSPLPSSLQHLIPSGSENLPPFRAKDKTHSNKNVNSASSTPQQEKRWVRIVDSITKSKYFQKATENRYIKKKLESVSNTPLMLMAELHQCRGTLSINIPPPPSDRIWYGFKDHPHMVLRAHPKLGERAVTVTSITDWIEKKLIQEFNKILLIPNMDDIPMPVMFNNLPSTPKQ